MNMRVLVAYGSERGGTEGLARGLADALQALGFATDVRAANEVGGLDGYDAVIVGGALYAGIWHKHARRFVKRNVSRLRELPTWLFSSGPLDGSAAQHDIPPTPGVQRLITAVGARGHATFGGRLAKDAKGFIASKMARTHAGDWRDPTQLRDWAGQIASVLRPAGAQALRLEREPLPRTALPLSRGEGT
jgi:menaquinone-dependent protoporphyrinogen oxidase